MSAGLLVLWIALIGADRIDLAGGNGPFIFTPFLALTPLVVAWEAHQRARARRAVTISRPGTAYALVVGALLCVVMISVFGAQEMPVSASRAFLLVAHVTGTFAVAILCADRPDLPRVLARGAILGVAIFLVFNVAEALYWIGRMSETLRVATAVIRLGNFQSLGPIPRLPGPVADANRGGYVLLFYIVAIAYGERRTLMRRVALTLAVGFLIATISRSAILGASVVLVATILIRRARVGPAPLIAAGLTVAASAVFFLAKPDTFNRVTTILASPVGQHLTAGEGSAKGHLELIRRGLSEATASVPRAAIGLGFGNSYLVLQDVFPGSRYGNFHSLYTTMFAEAGVLALLLTLVLLLTPLVAGGPWRALTAGSIMFNMFYQTTSEPVFWFALALAWLTIPVVVRRRPFRAASAIGT
jgi:hypothetical protein